MTTENNELLDLKSAKNHAETLIIEIESMVDKARDALGMSTSIGLAAHYKSQYDLLEAEVVESRTKVMWSMVILGILMIPFFALTAAEFLQPAIENEKNFWNGIIATLARASVMLPGIFFMVFCTKRHQTLFRLREEYGYRYTIAKSFQGFKELLGSENEDIETQLLLNIISRPPETIWQKLGRGENRKKEMIGIDEVVEILEKRIPGLTKKES